nr:MAG TPA: urocanase [Caudoviricetes sp.]
MADRAVRPTRIKTSHQPTVQENKPLGCFRGHPRSPCRLAGTHN